MKEKKIDEKRKFSTKKILISIGSIFILVLAAISFIFIPGMAQGAGKELPPFGYYDGKPIEYKQGSYFASSVQYFSEQESSQKASLTVTDEYNIFNNAFSSTVFNMAYTQAVEDSGYIVPTELLDRNMRLYFYDENGTFSQKLFNATPENTKLELRNSLVNSLEYNRYDNDLFGSQTDVMGNYSMYGLKTSSKETSFVKEMGEKQRSFEYVVFDMSEYPSDEAKEWGKSHSDLFTKYDLSVISLSEKSEAEKLLKQIQNNEILFEDAAAEYSKNYYSNEETGGKLGDSYKCNYQIKSIVKDEDAFNEITALPVGSITGVIETQNGYSIFKSNAPSTTPNFDDDELLEIVLKYMATYETGIIESYFIDVARDFANKAAQTNFSDASMEYNLTLDKINPSPLNYGDNPLLQAMSTTNASLANAAKNENFLKTAFSLQNDEISNPIVLGNNVIVMKLTGEELVQGNDTMFLYYTTSFDRVSVNTAIMTSDKLENNLMEVFFKYAFN